ncbi:MAG: deaminase [Chloroflexi bacterium HGW-Chloroflexi-4]|jgi:dihydrofolate reductase|nr:MAG: deaminase [Chloroflexi bacterium HGW-Chloroflexi-4]
MTKCSVFIATSLDGFIARPDGDFTWLDTSAPHIEGEDYGFAEFYSSIDGLVMGRKTYETALGFPEWPYAGKRLVVLSNSSILIPPHLAKDVEQMSASPHEVVRQLELTGASHLYVDGGLTIQGFLSVGLINEITMTTIPILLGSGIPLFGPLERDILLQIISSRSYPNGFVQTKYIISHSIPAD